MINDVPAGLPDAAPRHHRAIEAGEGDLVRGSGGRHRVPGPDELGPPPGPDDAHVIITLGHRVPAEGCFHTFNTFGFTCTRWGRRDGPWPGRRDVMPSRSPTPPAWAMGVTTPIALVAAWL